MTLRSAEPGRPARATAPGILSRDQAATATGPFCLHASAVAAHGRAVLILGAAGSGKSALALQLMAYGAALVSDDATILQPTDGVLWARAPDRVAGLIEARGIGLLAAAPAAPSPVAFAVDLDRVATERLPPDRRITLAGARVPVLHKVDSPHFAPAILQYLKGERAER